MPQPAEAHSYSQDGSEQLYIPEDFEGTPKDAYLNAKEEDIIIVKSPVGMPGRAIANKFMEATKNGMQPISKCYQCIKGCQAKDIPYCITKALVNSVKGNTDNGLVPVMTLKSVISLVKNIKKGETVRVQKDETSSLSFSG